jgi:hypothetical protein
MREPLRVCHPFRHIISLLAWIVDESTRHTILDISQAKSWFAAT